MSDDNQTATVIDDQVTLTVPEETAIQFPKLIELIKNSQSMDEEERQYWTDVLPIMSDEQLENLNKILNNEKQQLEEAENAYSQGMQQASKKAIKAFDEAAYAEKRRTRIEAEKLAEQKENEHEKNLLKELENL